MGETSSMRVAMGLRYLVKTFLCRSARNCCHPKPEHVVVVAVVVVVVLELFGRLLDKVVGGEALNVVVVVTAVTAASGASGCGSFFPARPFSGWNNRGVVVVVVVVVFVVVAFVVSCGTSPVARPVASSSE